jgi:hypothetical protein
MAMPGRHAQDAARFPVHARGECAKMKRYFELNVTSFGDDARGVPNALMTELLT